MPKVISQETSENPKQRSLGNLQVIKMWPRFPTSVCTSLASSPSANHLQTLFHLFFFCHGHWSSVPCQHSLYLRFPPDNFVPPLKLKSVSNPFCQYKVTSPTYCCVPRSHSQEPTPAEHQACFFPRSIKTALKTELFHQQDLYLPPFIPMILRLGGWGGAKDTSAMMFVCWYCVCVCARVWVWVSAHVQVIFVSCINVNSVYLVIIIIHCKLPLWNA